MIVCGLVHVRLAEEGRDDDVVSQALRHALRWRQAGLVAPPNQHLLSDRVAVTLPSLRLSRLSVGLAFADQRHLIALLVAYGWDSEQDRVHIGEVVWLDQRGPAHSLRGSVTDGFLDLVFSTLRAQALRADAFGGLGELLATRDGTTRVELHDREWIHLTRHAYTNDPCCKQTASSFNVTPADKNQLGAFGAGGWPAPAPPSGRLSVPVEVRNPGVAHRYMLQSGGPQRGYFFPERSPVEDVDVVIAGAGLAGLATAHALRPRQCLVLEFDDRIAGTSAAGDGQRGPFPLAAHYEHELPTFFGAEIIQLHQDLGIIANEPVDGLYPFVDSDYVVDSHRHEQYLDYRGRLWGDVWNLMEAPEHIEASRRIAEFIGSMPLPARMAAPPIIENLERVTFAAWAHEQSLEIPKLLRMALDTGFRSDYGGDSEQVSAFAGIHYLTCRPYLTAEPKTLSPPEGLSYFANRLLEHSPETEVRLHHLVRHIEDRGDHVEVLALDVEKRESRRFRCQHAVFAAPKKSVKWVFPADRRLFEKNVYAAWIVVTMEMARLPEKGMLYWSNGIYDQDGLYVGATWVNHHQPDEPPVLGHYIVFPPGRLHHLPALIDRPHRILRMCLRQLRALIGRDPTADVERVTIQKLGHAMPTPLPGTLFTNPNERRASKRVLYAGVDTGRLPLLIEAFDSGLEVARRIEENR